ncbi:MAG: DUF4382 domain-containing protein [Candidatus Aminicenantes bacterium]|nr:DUF4382 domain-containing protein [Candidatus Aminicenantes bacterium]
MKKLVYFVLPALFLLGACTSATTPQAGEEQASGKQGAQQGKFSLYITDAPLEAEEVVVNYREIAVHKTGAGFETIWTGTNKMDLIKLLNDKELLLDAELTAGFYTQIRFVIDSGHVVVGGIQYPLEVPSSEIKISANFQVQEGGTTTVVLDFDAEKSVHVTGAGKNNKKYSLRPVILVKSVSY